MRGIGHSCLVMVRSSVRRSVSNHELKIEFLNKFFYEMMKISKGKLTSLSLRERCARAHFLLQFLA